MIKSVQIWAVSFMECLGSELQSQMSFSITVNMGIEEVYHLLLQEVYNAQQARQLQLGA